MPSFLERPGLPRLAYELRAGAGPTIVFLPGYASDMSGAKALALDTWAARHERAFLRLDYSGCGASEGRFADGTLAMWRDDVLDALDRLTEGPLILVGSSMGGWLMLLAALARPDRIVALVGIAAAPDFTDWGYDDDMRAAMAEDGLYLRATDYADEPLVTMLDFWRSGQANLLLGGEIAVEAPVRLLHGLEDRDVPPSIAFRLGRALRSDDVQTIFVKGGDHRLSRPQDLTLLAATIASFAEDS
jgi:pimeloyl-ACP methyl ester carboxylesterase